MLVIFTMSEGLLVIADSFVGPEQELDSSTRGFQGKQGKNRVARADLVGCSRFQCMLAFVKLSRLFHTHGVNMMVSGNNG